MDSILVATDGSECSRAAVAAGIQLAKDEQAKLRFVHVVRPSEWLTEGGIREEDADSPLEQAAQQAHEQGIETELELIPAEDSVANEIIAYARASGSDLIVVGSRRRGRLATALLGSVSRELVSTADRPVLVVHQTDALEP